MPEHLGDARARRWRGIGVRAAIAALLLVPSLAAADDAFQRGVALYRGGQYEAALEAFNQAVQTADSASARANRGVTRMRLGDATGALRDYDAALAASPRDAEILFSRGNARLALGDHTGAIADYSSAIALAPRYGEAYSNRSTARRRAGDEGGSEADRQQATALLAQRPGAEPSSAPTPTQEAQPAPEPSKWTLADIGIKGTLQYKNFTHFEETPQDNRHVRNEGILEVEWRRKLAEWSDLHLIGRARSDDDEFADGVHFQIRETTKRRSILDLKEGKLRLHWDWFEASFGKQIFAWGTADAVNPTDNLNPYDFLDIIDRQKIGVYSAASVVTLGPLTHTFVVVPTFTPSRDPLLRSRWAPRLPTNLVAIIDDRELPERGPDEMQYATRLRATIAGVDLSISYYDGFENTPVIRESFVNVNPVAVLPPVIVPRFTPVYTRMKVPGFDFSTTVKKLEIHGEGAFKLVESRGRYDRFQWVAGINYNWDELPVKWADRVELILEYSRENVIGTESSAFQRSEGFFSAAFRNSLSGRVRLKFNEDTALSLVTTTNFVKDPNAYVQLKLSHKLTESLHVDTGFDLLAGPPDTFWGQWRHNNRAFLWLTYFY